MAANGAKTEEPAVRCRQGSADRSEPDLLEEKLRPGPARHSGLVERRHPSPMPPPPWPTIPAPPPHSLGRVEVWRGGGRLGISVSVPFVWRCLTSSTLAPFHIPLIEPDMRISRIRLSDKTSRRRPRRAAPTPGQTYEPEVPVEVRERISPASASPDLMFGPQPPAQPHRCVAVERAVGRG